MAYDKAHKKATIKYLKKLKEIRFRVKPEKYNAYKKAAEKAGYKSMSKFYVKAIEEKIEREDLS